MKLRITSSDFDNQPLLNRYFFARWLDLKNYRVTKEMEFGQLVELAFSITNDLHFDDSEEYTGVFNNFLKYREIRIAWDGKEPIDVLFYELNEKLKRRINQHLVVSDSLRRGESHSPGVGAVS